MSSHVDILINPVSGRARQRAALQLALDALGRDSFRVHRHQTTSPGHAAEICRRIPDDHRAVVICGGDGTVREVAEALMGRPLPFAIFPLGTENLAAKTFGFRACPKQLRRILVDGVVRRVDLARAGTRLFVIVCGIGFDADVVVDLTARRKGHISYASYVGPIWRAWWRHRFPRLRVEADGRQVFDGEGLVFVGNMNRYSLGLRILSQASWDDGLLDLCVYPCSSRLRLLSHAINTIMRRHTGAGRAIYVRCRRAKIESDHSVNVEMDGDQAGTLPLEIEVLPRKLSVLLPPG